MKLRIILTAVLTVIIFLVGVPVAAVALKGGLFMDRRLQGSKLCQ